MSGKLYVIGVGPGDPELLTLKAVKILRDVPCVCVPKSSEEGSSFALSIAGKVVNLGSKEIIEAHFPMKKTKSAEYECELDARWQETVETVLSRLNKGQDLAFLTIGDPTIYSTFFYLYDSLLELNPNLSIEIIPGVSSINASAAIAKISIGLADEKIAILPASYTSNIKETLEKFDTVILMKVHRVFNSILRTLEDMKLTKNAVYISRAGMENEKIFKDIIKVKEGDLNYFSIMIIKK